MRVDTIKTRVESAYGVCNQRLKLEDPKLLSTFAFKSDLRRYTKVDQFDGSDYAKVRRCRLTLSNPC